MPDDISCYIEQMKERLVTMRLPPPPPPRMRMNNKGDLVPIKPKRSLAWEYISDYHHLLDTGAGVVLRQSSNHGESMVYLPGHAIIDGKLISKPMLEPSDQPGVTMGERVEALRREVAKLQAEKTETAKHQQDIIALQEKLLVESTERFAAMRAEIDAERAANAQHGLSIAEEKTGFLSLFGKKGR